MFGYICCSRALLPITNPPLLARTPLNSFKNYRNIHYDIYVTTLSGFYGLFSVCTQVLNGYLQKLLRGTPNTDFRPTPLGGQCRRFRSRLPLGPGVLNFRLFWEDLLLALNGFSYAWALIDGKPTFPVVELTFIHRFTYVHGTSCIFLLS